MALPNTSRETKFSGAKGDREILIFPVQLTASRIGNLTRLILALAICVTIHIELYMRPKSPLFFCNTNTPILPRGPRQQAPPPPPPPPMKKLTGSIFSTGP